MTSHAFTLIKHTPGLRKPGARELRGLRAIDSEMHAAADDMRTYGGGERKRANDIYAGLSWIAEAISRATGDAK